LRRGLTLAAALAICVGIAAYGALLFERHLASVAIPMRTDFTLMYGRQATRTAYARPTASNALVLEGHQDGDASAEWSLRAPVKGRPQELRFFIAASPASFDAGSGYVTVSIGERRIGVLRAGRPRFDEDASFSPREAPDTDVDASFGYVRAYGFAVPPGTTCVVRACAVRVAIHGGHWRIDRVGLLERLPMESVAGTAQYGSPVAIIAVALGLTAFVTFATSRARAPVRLRTQAVRRNAVSVPTLASGAACAAYVALVLTLAVYQAGRAGHGVNRRAEFLERLGSQAVSLVGAHEVRQNTLALHSERAEAAASASWSMPATEMPAILAHSRTCGMQLYVAGIKASGTGHRARADILLNGEIVERIRFGGASAAYPATEAGRTPPANLLPAQIPMTPAFAPYAMVVPLAEHACNATRWDVGVALFGARWEIDRVGLIATYVPAREALLPQNGITWLLAALVIAGLLLGTYLLFATIARNYGIAALSLTLAVCAVAPLTHDEWDFPAWLRMVDFAAIAHDNPAVMWGGLPLWPGLLALIAPVVSASYAIFGSGNQEQAALALKVAMALAACFNAYAIANAAPHGLRRLLFPALLLAPLGLYEVTAGYRELFAGSLALVGLGLTQRRRLTWAALAFAAAASISESLVPLVLLPASLRITSRDPNRIVVLRALGDAAAGVLPLAVEWIFIAGNGAAALAVSTRLTAAYRLGGGSWLGALEGLDLLPADSALRSPWFGAALLLALSTPLVVTLIGMRHSEVRTQERTCGVFLGLVSAIFLSYRGIDPSTWYALFVITAWYFARFQAYHPLPHVLAIAGGVAFYAILGVTDFANATYVLPHNASLLGLMKRPSFLAILVVNLIIMSLYASAVGIARGRLFGRASTWIVMLYLGSVATIATNDGVSEFLLCAAASVAIAAFLIRLDRLRDEHGTRRTAVIDYSGLIVSIAGGAIAGTRNASAMMISSAGLFFGLSRGLGLCDVVLIFGAQALLGSQYGFGWVSIAGNVALSLIALFALYTGYAYATRSFSDASPLGGGTSEY